MIMSKSIVSRAVTFLVIFAMLTGVMFFTPAVNVLANNTTYYVDSVGGNDSNNGTSTGTAWQTLTKVNSVTFQPGDQILFKAGCSFAGQLYPKGSGSSGSPIIIDMYGTGNKPIIAGNTDNSTDGAAVLLKNQQYWEIKNLEITNAAGRLGVKINKDTTGTSSYFRLTNLVIHNINGAQPDINYRDYGGIYFANAVASGGKFDDVIISGCSVYDILVIGIQNGVASTATTDRSTNTKITNTVVHNCGQDGIIWRSADGAIIEYTTFYTTGTSANRALAGCWTKTSNGAIIQFCEGYNNTDGAGGPDGMAYDFDIDTDNNILQYSYSHDNEGGFWMNCPGTVTNTGNIVRYNISQNDHDKTIWFQGISENTQIYNNTIYAGTGYLGNIIRINGSPSGNTVKNNIIVNNTSAIYDNSSNVTWDYNCFYGNHPASEPSDAHKLTSDPMLVSPGSGGNGLVTVDGYKLQTGSPSIYSGTLISNNGGRDFWGNSVSSSSSPSRGAYNGTGVGGTPTPTPTGSTLLNDNFDSDISGALPIGWSETISGRTTVVEDPSATDMSMRVTNLTSDSGNTTASNSFTATSTGTVTVTFKFKPEQTNCSTQLDVPDSSGYQTGVVCFGLNGMVQYKSNDTFYNTSMSYSSNTWYDVKLVLDMANKTYSLYVSDMNTPKASNVAFASLSASNVATVRVIANHTSATTGVRVNNLLITAQGGGTLLNDNFDSYTTGLLPTGWSETISGRTTVVEDPSATDKSMRVTNLSTDSGNTMASKSFTTTSTGTVTVTFTFKPEQTNCGTQLDIVDSNGYQTCVATFTATGAIQYKSNGTFYNTSMSYSANTWYDVKMVLDMTNKTYSLYVTDMATPKASNVAFASSSAANVAKVDAYANHTSATTGARVNNLLIVSQ